MADNDVWFDDTFDRAERRLNFVLDNMLRIMLTLKARGLSNAAAAAASRAAAQL